LVVLECLMSRVRSQLSIHRRVLLAGTCLLSLSTLGAGMRAADAATDLAVCTSSRTAPCRAPTPDSAEVARGARGNPIAFFWTGAADLTVAARIPGPLRLEGGFQGELRPVPGADYQAIAIRLPSRDIDPVEIVLKSGDKVIVRHRWPSRMARPALRGGRLVQRELVMGDAGAARTLSIYVPEQYASDPQRALVILADGQNVLDYAKVIDAATAAGRLPKVLIVGVWNDPASRADEYVPGRDPLRAGRLTNFVTDVVLPAVTRDFGAPRRTYVAGMSDGAAWALAFQAAHADLIDGVVALSPVYGPIASWPQVAKRGRVFVGWGRDENRPAAIAKNLEDAARGGGAILCKADAPGGHEAGAWAPLFLQGVTWLIAGGDACW